MFRFSLLQVFGVHLVECVDRLCVLNKTLCGLLQFLNVTSTLRLTHIEKEPISGRVDRASVTEAVDLGSIPGRVRPNIIKIGIHSFPA